MILMIHQSVAAKLQCFDLSGKVLYKNQIIIIIKWGTTCSLIWPSVWVIASEKHTQSLAAIDEVYM